MVVRKRPHDDRREACGKRCRSPGGQEFDARVVDRCKIRDVTQRCGSRLVFRGQPELRSGKLHGRHSVSAQGAHAGKVRWCKAQEEIYMDRKQSQPR